MAQRVLAEAKTLAQGGIYSPRAEGPIRAVGWEATCRILPVISPRWDTGLQVFERPVFNFVERGGSMARTSVLAGSQTLAQGSDFRRVEVGPTRAAMEATCRIPRITVGIWTRRF